MLGKGMLKSSRLRAMYFTLFFLQVCNIAKMKSLVNDL